ncbi:unnamed protein product, partial [Ilex paraguariensis]
NVIGEVKMYRAVCAQREREMYNEQECIFFTVSGTPLLPTLERSSVPSPIFNPFQVLEAATNYGHGNHFRTLKKTESKLMGKNKTSLIGQYFL